MGATCQCRNPYTLIWRSETNASFVAQVLRQGDTDFIAFVLFRDRPQRLYLNLPWFHEDYRAGLQAQRERLLQLIKKHPAP
jgi:hypothetical protein